MCIYEKIAETIQKTALYGGTQKEELSKLLDELISRGSEHIVLPLSKDVFGMSIGAVFYPQAEKKFSELLQMADKAMYRVKKIKKNGWEIV